ncbi:helicase-associated domain-containing protein [Streptomyces sp. NPDC001380]|uniref:helicase-associated domain-containing protein n=1 Tax=Streptomyces sp. NPDC001380 TaxID=3364566 RepID=UPI00369EA721
MHRSAAALTSWLADRTPDQLTVLLRERGLPAAAAYEPQALGSLRGLAAHLLGDHSTAAALGLLTLPELQVLTAAAGLADRRYGPWDASGTDPAERAVPRAALLDALARDRPSRQAAEECLDRLAARALVLPPHGADVAVPALVHRRSARLRGLGRPAAALLGDAFNAGEIHAIAAELGLPKARNRDEAQRAVAAVLGDRTAVRALVSEAPQEALDLLEQLVPGPPALLTRCFTAQYGYYVAGRTKFAFRPGGSGDPGTDWLAARGMVVPVGTDLVELVREVAEALREDGDAWTFDALPPRAAGLVPLPARAADEAQAAAAAAAARAELLLRAVAEQPPSLRKAGGIAVRDTRRLAKAAGVPEEQARLWLDLAANADLLAPVEEEPPPRTRGRRSAPPPQPAARLLPTARYDAWLAEPPAGRLLPLLATWAVVPEVFTHWPEEDGTPVALVGPQDPGAVTVRRVLLDALADLPGGRGLGPAGADSLRDAVAWRRPLEFAGAFPEERARATLAEAELLGVVAHGALTPVGHAVRGLLDSGADRWFPAVPGAGPRLDAEPAVDAAVRRLTEALAELLPPPQTTARFQADLTAVVAGAASPELTDLLSSCAVRESEGHAMVWRISAASVRRALDGGLDAADLLERLAAASADGRALPQPLEYLVKDAARTHGRMRVVRSACCVRSDDEALVLELSRSRVLARLGLRRIAPTVLVSAAEPDAALAALRAAGYAPVLEAASGTTVVERVPGQRAPSTMPPLSRAVRRGGPGPHSAEALAAKLLGR